MLAPSSASRPAPSLIATDDLGSIVRVVGHQQPAARLLVPAKAGDAVVVTVQDARLAGRRRGRQHRDPGWSVAAPSRTSRPSTGSPPGPHRLLQDRQAQAVDLDHEQPRHRLDGASEVASHQPPDQHAVVGIVVAHRHELGEQAVEHRQQHGSPDRSLRAGPPRPPARRGRARGWPRTGRPGPAPGRRGSAMPRAASEGRCPMKCRGRTAGAPPATADRGRRWSAPGARRS